MTIFSNWFHLHFTENKGMAFGIELWGEYGKLFLTLFRIVAVTGLIYMIHYQIKRKASIMAVVSLSLILAGAIGNIIDSVIYGLIFSASKIGEVATFLPEGGGYAPIFYGQVVDMLYFPLYQGFLPEWIPIWGGKYITFFRPIFNIADSAISMGFVLILIFQRSLFPEPPPKDSATDAASLNTKTVE